MISGRSNHYTTAPYGSLQPINQFGGLLLRVRVSVRVRVRISTVLESEYGHGKFIISTSLGFRL